MEQRTLIAITLSLLVLLAYNALIPKPGFKPKKIYNSQDIASKEDANIVVESSSVQILNSTAQSPSHELTPPALDILQHIDTENLIFESTNIGGSLKSVTIKKYTHKLPITNIINFIPHENSVFQLSEITNGRIVYSFADKNFNILKTYQIIGDGGTIDAQIKITNISNMSKLENIAVSNFIIKTSDITEQSVPISDRSLYEYSVSKEDGIFRKNNAFSFSQRESTKKMSSVNWLGFRDRYYCAIIKPQFTITSYSIEPVDSKDLKVSTHIDAVKIDPGEAVTYNFTAYFGLQDTDILRKHGHGFEEIISFSSFSVIDFISKSIVKLMSLLHKIIPSWGLCIILMSAFVYLAMYPLTLKGMVSMKKMQLLQPKIAQLREQYKNQPQKLNKEITELYRENKVNPFSGCFPFILQMPVFIGLYQALWRTVYLKGASFLWIKDLASPDRLFVFSTALPLIGNEFNILPVVMAIVMFFQQKLSSKNIITADPAQIAQQKIMATIFPIMLGFIFYKFASGLTLYFTLFYLLSTITQWKMSKV